MNKIAIVIWTFILAIVTMTFVVFWVLKNWSEYTPTAAVTEGLASIAPIRRAIAEYYFSHESYPSNNAEAGLSDPLTYKDGYVSSITVSEGGVLMLKYHEGINTKYAFPELTGLTITLVPREDNGMILWSCKKGKTPARYVPSDCMN